ncbi:MAG: hypothetical protein ACFN3H_01235 [Spirochaetales bacterium]
MNNRLLRISGLTLQTIASAVIVFFSVYAMAATEDILINYQYVVSVLRVLILMLVTVAYYKTTISSINPGNPFILCWMLFASFAELRILSSFSNLTCLTILSSRIGVRVQIFSQFMLHFSLIGFALHYQNNDYNAMSSFMILGTAGILFLSLISPAAQNIPALWSLSAPLTMLTIFAAVTLLTHIILAFAEPTSLGSLRHIATILMIIGNFISTVFASLLSAATGTVLFTIGGVTAMIISLRDSVLL